VEAAAAGVIRLVEQNLLHAVQEISSQRGHDPRRFVLVAAGGAGPMHGTSVGRLLGCREVYVPRLSGVFCALGMLHSDVRHDFVRVHLARLDRADTREIEDVYAELAAAGARALATDGFEPGAMRFLREMDLRYLGQQYDLRVAVTPDHGGGTTALREAFEREHARMFGHTQPEGIVEISTLRLIAIGTLPPLSLPTPAPVEGPPQRVGERPVWLGAETGWADTAIFTGESLAPGHSVHGPALVEERTTTVLVGATDTLEVDATGNFRIRLGPSD
jgi:N-methylhydantoinase A